jgi:RNA polymerase sigma-70 factor (ECF subfamily)
VLPEKQLVESALLVTCWQRGDRSAFEGLLKLWEQSIFYYLRRLTSSEADAWELLQETWLKIFRSLGTLRDPRGFPGYLYATARNTAMSYLRRQGIGMSSLTSDDVHDPLAADEVALFDNAELVHHALDQLPLSQREVLTLFFLQDLSLEQMAAVLGIPLGTVKSRLHYAKLAIRNLLSTADPTAQSSFQSLNQQAIRNTLSRGTSR